MKSALYSVLHFNIDDHINPHIPSSRVSRLPTPISHFLGYRKTPQSEVPNLLVWTWAFIGAFLSLLTVESLNKYAPGLRQYNPPVIIASLGASAILDYNAIHTPLAQPRNAFFGQTFSAIIGVCIAKLFQLSPNFDEYQWIAGALACAISSFVMGMTNTVHPPGGATAVLASTNTAIIAMGWMFIPFVILGSVIMLTIALIINNIQRQYPNYWWTNEELPRNKINDLEKVVSNDSDQTLRHDDDPGTFATAQAGSLVVNGDKVIVPPQLRLTQSEMDLLSELQRRMREGSGMDLPGAVTV